MTQPSPGDWPDWVLALDAGEVVATGDPVTVLIAFALVFGLGVFPLEPRTLVPIAGMVIGNAMKSQVVSAQRTVDAVARRRLQLEARLAPGQPSEVAARPVTARCCAPH